MEINNASMIEQQEFEKREKLRARGRARLILRYLLVGICVAIVTTGYHFAIGQDKSLRSFLAMFGDKVVEYCLVFGVLAWFFWKHNIE